MSKLAAALRAKFSTPKKVLEALNLDPSLLDEARREAVRLANDAKRGLARDDQDVSWHADSPTLRNPAVEEGERLARAKDGGQMTGAEVEKIVRLLREAGVGSRAIQACMQALQNGGEDDAGEGFNERDRDRLRREEAPDGTALDDIEKFLRDHRLGEVDIAEAFRLGGVDRRRAARDALGQNALRDGGGFGGRLAGDKAIAMDRLKKKFPGVENITTDSGFGVHRHEIDRRPGPSRAQLERFYDRFPGARGITAG